jgi:CheY-like chemotaxis protein
MGKKILLADDSITIQKVIELTFSDEDFDVITVGNGRLALEKLPEVRPDIVLCDIIMPERDGYEVCEQIKANPAFAHTPVLLLTGAFEPFDQERATRAHYDGSLAKPFEPETLIAKVKDLLARAPAPGAEAAPATSTRPPLPPAAPKAAPPVVQFPRAVPPPSPPAAAPAAGSFIPDEPFGSFDDSAFSGGAQSRGTSGVSESRPPLAEISDEEAESLSPPPAEPPPPSEDGASTVMFRASDLPWNAPAPSPARPAAAPPPAPPSPPRSPEPVFVPEPPEIPEPAEAPVVEEVIDEDLEFGQVGFVPEPTGADEGLADQGSSTVMFSSDTRSPAAPPSDEAATGAFSAISPRSPEPERARPAEQTLAGGEPLLEPEPEVTFETAEEETTLPGSERPELEPEMLEPEPEPESAPERGAPAEESFAGVAPPEPESAPKVPSQAAAVAVPVDMVEKIAQRVVAQISERVVKEIAWDVVPELAEALIKREIEKLKAELDKL